MDKEFFYSELDLEESILSDRGSIITGSEYGKAEERTIGTGGQVLVPDSREKSGMKWQDDNYLYDTPLPEAGTEGITPAHQIIYTGQETVEHILNDTINSGVLHEIAITDAGGLNITWTAGSVWDSTAATVIETGAGSGTCTTDVANYLYWDRSGGGTTLTLSATKWDVDDNDIAVGIIVTQSNDIYEVRHIDILKQRESDINSALREIFKCVVTDGLLVTEDVDATNAFDVQISSGQFYHFGIGRHILSAGFNTRTTAMTRWYHSGGDWTTDTNAQIDITKYDNGTDLAAVSANKYYKSMFMYSENMIHWIYPQVGYDTVAQAIAAPLPTIPTIGNYFPRSTAVVLKGNDVAFPTAGGERWIDIRPLFGTSIIGNVTDHASLANLAWSVAGHTMDADLDMGGSYQVVDLQAPAASGEAIRQTATITETNLATVTDTSDADALHKHSTLVTTTNSKNWALCVGTQ